MTLLWGFTKANHHHQPSDTESDEPKKYARKIPFLSNKDGLNLTLKISEELQIQNRLDKSEKCFQQ